jgi:alcohol dehydrogenase
MEELLFLGPREVRWADANPPQLDSDLAALVRPLVVSTCDMDAVALSGLIRFRARTPLGHETVAEVVDVGDSVERVRPGDRVIVPWQISCGDCQRCRHGQDAYCLAVPPGSCYGWGPHAGRWRGFLADQVLVPYADHMLVPLPEGVDPRVASGLSDNVVDAWRAVGPPLEETGGSDVLVVGSDHDDGGSIGVYAAGLACSLGAARAVLVSRSAGLCGHAESLGAESLLVDGDYPDLGASFDITVDASASPEGLAFAIRSTGKSGICTSTSAAVYRGADVPLPVHHMYLNAVTFRTGWVHTRPLMARPLELIASGRLDPAPIARNIPWHEAEAALAEPFTKLVLAR